MRKMEKVLALSALPLHDRALEMESIYMPWDVNHEMVQLQRPTQPPWRGHLGGSLSPPCSLSLPSSSAMVLASSSSPTSCCMAMIIYSCMGKMEKVLALSALPLHDRALEMESIYIYIYIYI